MLHKSRPPLFVIRKQKRNSPLSGEVSFLPSARYSSVLFSKSFVLLLRPERSGLPGARPLLRSELATGRGGGAFEDGALECGRHAAVRSPFSFLQSLNRVCRLNSTKGSYSWKFTEPTKRSKKTAEESGKSSEALNSRPTPYQHSRTGMLLRILHEQMQETAAAAVSLRFVRSRPFPSAFRPLPRTPPLRTPPNNEQTFPITVCLKQNKQSIY